MTSTEPMQAQDRSDVVCPGCVRIVEYGEHGIHLSSISIFTPMPAVVQIHDAPSPPLGEEMTFHNGRCLWRWLVRNERIQNSFAEWLESEKLYLVVVQGTSSWFSGMEVVRLMSRRDLVVHLKGRVREPDGTERPMNEAEKAWVSEL